jgi:DNA modification methylase
MQRHNQSRCAQPRRRAVASLADPSRGIAASVSACADDGAQSAPTPPPPPRGGKALTRRGGRPTFSRRKRWQVIEADCLELLPDLDPDTFDSVITDPPYGISISGMSWDSPHRLDPKRSPRCRSRTPKSMEYQRFTERWGTECLRVMKPGAHLVAFSTPRACHLLTSGLENAGFEIRDLLVWLHSGGFPAGRQLPGGFGTAIRPAVEPIILARKPCEGTLVQNFARYGTGALAIDACRLNRQCSGRSHTSRKSLGRRPPNVILCHNDTCTSARCDGCCPARLLGAESRHYFCVKPSRSQRDAGCERLPRRVTQTFKLRPDQLPAAEAHPVANFHPTVKPLDLLRWLVRLLTPFAAGGEAIVLDPFVGSGTTGAAAVLEGARFVGIEREASYVPIARARITHWSRRGPRCTAERARARRTSKA